MNLVCTKTLPVIAAFSLAACTQLPSPPISTYTKAPNTSFIEVIFDDDGCPVETQTVVKTCPFIGTKDPRDIACQEPSSNNARRKVVWEGSELFTLDFHGSTPFTSTNGRCKIATEDSGFSCKLRKDSEAPPLEWDYKYDVVVNAGEANECRLDPRIYLMR